ncbi:MAG TPA: pyridoxamine 5'-phosphate oxidase family protein, partial [Gemmatimonadales bacterium]|nr:pyridoxamine 5'-phosphate oxidase family protein [Gemmatimonadales bacterium]
VFRDMDQAECEALLKRHHHGRIAFSFKDRVDIQPISYLFEGEWLVGRTQHGSKLRTLQQSPWVAFEVDETDGPFDWRSVVIRGTVYILSPGTPEYEENVAAIQALLPAAFTEDDPTPERDVVFRIYPRDMTGRSASSRAPDAKRPAPGA